MKRILLLSIIFLTTAISAQVTHYDWPTASGQALLSDKYRVFIKHGTDPEQEIEVLMSLPDPNDIQYDGQGTELTGRSFSYASVSYNNISSPGITFRIVKTFGNNSTKTKISPKSYNITPTIASNEVSFAINSNNKYISIDFEDPENETSTKKWIKHMLTISVDPPEIDVPNLTDPGVLIYSNTVSPTALENSTTIFFTPGYYNLKDYQFGSLVIDDEGILYLGNGKKIYLAGGAFVEGLINRTNFNDTNQKIYGRGILSGRQYIWQDGAGNKPYGQIVKLGKFAEINGIHIVDSPQHGIVSPDGMKVENLKFLGWHANNDAIRIGNDSEIKNSFIRAVDDFFYNYNIYVHDCVLWAGHNGAIMTYGWASIDTGSSLMENIDIINPEWSGLGNNNGLIAAQVNLDFNPIDYGTGSTTTTFRNIRIEGSIPGLTNIKPRSSANGEPSASQVPVADLGYLGDVHMENITIENQFDKGRIRGQVNATTTGINTYFTKNINFTNITIGGVKLTNLNSSLYFDIETATTQNITFDIGIPPAVSSVQTETFTSANLNSLSTNVYATVEKGITKTELEAVPVGTGKWFVANPSGTNANDFEIKNSGGNPSDYLTRVAPSDFARGTAYVFNNTNGDATGLLNMSFDYFWKSPMTADRISYRVWGVKTTISDTNKEYFRVTGGSGTSGDNFAVGFEKGIGSGNPDVVELSSSFALGTSENWKTVNYTIDVTGYNYIVIMFAGAYGAGNGQSTDVFGLDNVTVPTNKTLSTDSFENKNQISVFPNPTTNTLYLNNIAENFDYNIYSTNGQIVKSALQTKNNSIDVSTLANGYYLLEIKNEQKQKEYIKFIKK